MRISSGIMAALLVALLATAAAAGSKSTYATPQAAFEQGLSAYKAGNYDVAVRALEEAVAKGRESSRFFAEFYLARIYSDAAGAHTDHAKAYMLFQKLADENVDADPDEGNRAPFVAKALTALAGYLRAGVPELRIEPDEERAVEYLQNAATSFGDQEAQFELAKIYLNRGGSGEVKLGRHFLSVLAKEGYVNAQAYLADLYWRGRFVKKDEQRALALITVAAENAPAHERIWIDDIYFSIYCGSTQVLRKQADGVLAALRQMFTRQRAGDAAERGEAPNQRRCRSGEVVEIHRGAPATAGLAESTSGAMVVRPAASGRGEVLQGSAAGLGLRDVGAGGRE